MRILSCYIENFGTLSQFLFRFDEELTVLQKENGWGKSTLAAFIKAMFYGLDNKPRTKRTDSDRKRYQPWQMGAYGGQLVFEAGQKTYRVERTFGVKASADTFALYDNETGMLSTDYTENLGEELFAVDKESFGYTIFFSQRKLEFVGTDVIFANLSAEEGEIDEQDMDRFSMAMKRLEEEGKEYKKTGGRGSLDLKINQITKLREEIKIAGANAKMYEEWNRKRKQTLGQIKTTKQQLEEIKKQVEVASEAESSRIKLEQLKSLRNREKMILEQIEEGRRHFKTNDPDEIAEKRASISEYTEDAKAYHELLQELAKQENKYETMEMIQQNRNHTDATDTMQEPEQEEPDLTEKTSGEILWMVLAVLSLFAAIASYVMSRNIYGLSLLVLPVLCVLIFFIKKNKAAERRKEAEEIKSAKQRQRQEQIKVRQQEQMAWQQQLQEKEQQIKEIKQQLSERKEMLIQGLVQYHMDGSDDFSTAYVMLHEMIKSYEKLCREYQELQREMEGFLANIDEEKLKEKARTQYILCDVMAQQQEMEKLLYQQLEEERRFELQIQRLEGQEELVQELEQELEQLEEELEQEKIEYENLVLTMKLLEEAKVNYSSRYMVKVKEEFEKLTQQMRNSDIQEHLTSQPVLDAKLQLNVQAMGQSRELEYFSAGTKDAIRICARLALIKALFRKEKPFLLLDDPFSELDEEHLKQATNLIRQMAKEYQIVYLTCSKERNFTQ